MLSQPVRRGQTRRVRLELILAEQLRLALLAASTQLVEKAPPSALEPGGIASHLTQSLQPALRSSLRQLRRSPRRRYFTRSIAFIVGCSEQIYASSQLLDTR